MAGVKDKASRLASQLTRPLKNMKEYLQTVQSKISLTAHFCVTFRAVWIGKKKAATGRIDDYGS
jgi:hypothetical protein